MRPSKTFAELQLAYDDFSETMYQLMQTNHGGQSSDDYLIALEEMDNLRNALYRHYMRVKFDEEDLEGEQE